MKQRLLFLLLAGLVMLNGCGNMEHTGSGDEETAAVSSAAENSTDGDVQTDSLTTDEIVDIVLENPRLLELMAFNSYTQGLRTMAERSSVFRELFRREDGAQALVRAYQNLEVDYELLTDENAENSLSESGYDKELFLQILLIHPDFSEDLTEADIVALVEAFADKYEQKRGLCEDYADVWTLLFALRDQITDDMIPENILEEWHEAYAERTTSPEGVEGEVVILPMERVFDE